MLKINNEVVKEIKNGVYGDQKVTTEALETIAHVTELVYYACTSEKWLVTMVREMKNDNASMGGILMKALIAISEANGIGSVVNIMFTNLIDLCDWEYVVKKIRENYGG